MFADFGDSYHIYRACELVLQLKSQKSPCNPYCQKVYSPMKQTKHILVCNEWLSYVCTFNQKIINYYNCKKPGDKNAFHQKIGRICNIWKRWVRNNVTNLRKFPARQTISPFIVLLTLIFDFYILCCLPRVAALGSKQIIVRINFKKSPDKSITKVNVSLRREN